MPKAVLTFALAEEMRAAEQRGEQLGLSDVKQARATVLVLEQAEVLCQVWAA